MAQKKLKNHNDIKILILYLLKNVGRPLSFNDLNDVVLQSDLVGYMDYALCLDELVDTGNLRQLPGEKDEVLYEITEQGVSVADTLESDITGFIRTKSLQAALRYLSFKEKNIRVPVTISPRPDGKFDMIFSLTQQNESIFELKLIADNDYQASRMQYVFQNEPERVYRSILSLMSGDADYVLKN